MSDPNLFKWAIVALAVLSALLYLIGRIRTKKVDGWDALRAAIPAGALLCWSALQTPSGIEAAFSNVSAGALRVGGAIVGIALALAAAALGIKADKTDPPAA